MAAYSGISARGGARDHLRAMGTEGRKMERVKTKQVFVGLVGYGYQQITADSRSTSHSWRL